VTVGGTSAPAAPSGTAAPVRGGPAPADAPAFSWRLSGRCWRLGHDVPHMGGVVPMRIVSEMRFDPKDIVPHLFEETDPGFHERCRPGDVIVAGRNFGMGPKMQGYIAMKALGLGLVVESMPFLAYREAIGIGLPVLTDCPDATLACETGERLEVDFLTGRFLNLDRGIERAFPPVPEALREIVELGGTTAWLARWWAQRRAADPA
jgi:3-isopropylmalate/(R)-2-methylmalate dehydratase small subunit